MARVVTFHYVLKDKAGKTLDSSQGNEPMTYLEGSGSIIPGLETVITTLKTGDKKHVPVKAAEAYGEHDAKLVAEVPRAQFPEGEQIEAGMRFRAGEEHEHGPVFTVTKVTETHVHVDGNHPLAGVDLFFDVEIVDTRDATLEEVKHGHAHGPGGHHH